MKTDSLLLILIVGVAAYFMLWKKSDTVQKSVHIPASSGSPVVGTTQESGVNVFDDILKAITGVIGAVTNNSTAAQTSGQRN